MKFFTLHYDFLDPADRTDYMQDYHDYDFDTLAQNGKLTKHQDSEYSVSITIEIDD